MPCETYIDPSAANFQAFKELPRDTPINMLTKNQWPVGYPRPEIDVNELLEVVQFSRDATTCQPDPEVPPVGFAVACLGLASRG